MNYIIVYREQIAKLYHECMIQHIESTKDDLTFHEQINDLKQFYDNISLMLSKDLYVSRKAFANAFKVGDTMMLLECEDMDRIEKWHLNNEKFQIVIFTEEGEPVGLFEGEDIYW